MQDCNVCLTRKFVCLFVFMNPTNKSLKIQWGKPIGSNAKVKIINKTQLQLCMRQISIFFFFLNLQKISFIYLLPFCTCTQYVLVLTNSSFP